MNWFNLNDVPFKHINTESTQTNEYSNNLQRIVWSQHDEKEFIKVEKSLQFQSDLSDWMCWPWTQLFFSVVTMLTFAIFAR